MIKILSLDMQGTLTDSAFSDYFWIELLPQKYSEKFNCSIESAKQIISDKFSKMGKYNIKYYDDMYWAKWLGFETINELNTMDIIPKVNNEMYDFINTIKLPKIIISTTTELFIRYELKEKITDFYKTYSCIDYFKVGGKTKDVFLKVCKELQISPKEMLHIGDSKIMDYENAKKAGINAVLYDGNLIKLKKEVNKYLEV